MTVPDVKKIASKVQEQFGSESMNLLPEHSEFGTVNKFISFGHWGLDKIVSGMPTGGGVPVGRLTEIFGAPSSGKSLLIAHLVANCQKQGGIAILDDTEHAYMKEFGEIVGINNDQLLYSASETVEEVFSKMEYTLKTILSMDPNTLILYAWDSLALVSSIKELEKDLMDGKDGYNVHKAKAINEGVRKVVSLIGKYNIAMVIANQTRQNIGVMFGDKETTPGGDAVPFWASVRLRLSRKEAIKVGSGDTTDIVGIKGEAVAKKNKISAPFKSCKYDILFDQGVMPYSGCVEMLVKDRLASTSDKGGIVALKGYEGTFKKSAVEKFFEANPDQIAIMYED